jgi:hypothetical protein
VPKESRAWHGVRIARPARIALDLLLRLSPRKRGWVRRLRIGVPDLDAYARSGQVRRSALRALFWGRRNRGIRLARSLCISPILEPNHYRSRNCVLSWR